VTITRAELDSLQKGIADVLLVERLEVDPTLLELRRHTAGPGGGDDAKPGSSSRIKRLDDRPRLGLCLLQIVDEDDDEPAPAMPPPVLVDLLLGVLGEGAAIGPPGLFLEVQIGRVAQRNRNRHLAALGEVLNQLEQHHRLAGAGAAHEDLCVGAGVEVVGDLLDQLLSGDDVVRDRLRRAESQLVHAVWTAPHRHRSLAALHRLAGREPRQAAGRRQAAE
jgi:hypothetical protein